MPPNKHLSGNYKQKNKPFKGKSNKNKHTFKVQTAPDKVDKVVTKKIAKKDQNKVDRRNQADQIKQNKVSNQETKLEKNLVLNSIFESDTKEKVLNTLKNINPPRIIALIPFNSNANAHNIKNGLEKYIKDLQAKTEELNMEDTDSNQQFADKLNFKFPYFQFFANPKTMSGLVKENFMFVACDRNLQNTLDVCKVADIICPILSCSECNLEQTNLDPYGQAGAFDDFAYRVITCLRVQGMAPSVCVLQDLEKFAANKRPQVKKLFSRFFAGEFSENVTSLEDEHQIIPFLRKLQTTPLKIIDWRENRAYMLADQIAYDKQTNLLEVQGFLKGNYMNANQLVHITGYDDYQIEKIEVLRNPYKLRLKSKKVKQDLLSQQRKQTLNTTNIMQEEDINNQSMVNDDNNALNQSMISKKSRVSGKDLNTLDNEKDIIMTQHSDPAKQESMAMIIKKSKTNFVIKDGNILNAIDEEEDENDEKKNFKNDHNEEFLENNEGDNKIFSENNNKHVSENDTIENMIKQERKEKRQQKKIQKQQNNQMEGEDGMDQEDASDFDEEDDDDSEMSYDDINAEKLAEEKRNKKMIELDERKEDELFEDEAEYGTELQLREKYEKYQTLKSFKTSEWDAYQNLPEPYEQIYTFKHFLKTKRLAMAHAQEQAFAYAGFYVKIYLKNFPIEKLQNHQKENPFILSGLLRHERKMTQLHLKIKKNPELENTIFESKKSIEIHLGFKRIVTEPIYSKLYNNNAKTKYVEQIKDNNYYIASFYHPCVYGGNPLIFDNEQNKTQAIHALSGEIFKVDPMHVILKRRILTGYPHKINKRKAVVKFMFFNVEDIRYFKPVELKTEGNIRGHIIEPLGTHGLMKVQFNTGIKQHDIIMLQLYKRVYPKNLTFAQ